MQVLYHWLIGLFVSLAIGHFVTHCFVRVLQKATGAPKGQWDEAPDWLRKTLMGIMERLFFTIAIAAGLSGTAIAMVAWTTLKGLLYWAKFKEAEVPASNTLIGILGSLMSLIWAIIGAFICTGDLCNWLQTLNPR